ncbi:MAG: sigma-70 family RNA polymerase sigma factor [Ottowia sp.]|uniref:sigma-70 family RNA polymerase sigma factor n=1 Tax=Ottowia sp. TaxID=1898956 RepID=UPI0039E61326
MSTTSACPAVQVLYADHQGWLKAWLLRRLGNEFDAADVAHDVFVRLLRRGEPPQALREPRAYLATIANGLAVSHIRRRALEQAYLEALAHQPPPQAISPERQAIVWQTLIEVDTALATLPPRARQAFLMAQLDGLKQRDIAAALGLSVPTIKKYMQKAWLACLCLMADD